MADQLTAAGLEIDDLETRTDNLVAQLRADISPILDVSAGSAMGQFVRIFSERTQSVMELIQAVYSAQYPDTASGFSLTALSILTGTERNPATNSFLLSTEASVELGAGVTLPAGSVAHVTGDPTARFTSDVNVTNGGGAPAWIPCAFTAESTGPVQALSGTLETIAEPVAGWLQVTNSADATEGEEEETDAALRLRREAELQTGSTAVGAILTTLTQIEGVIWAFVGENNTDFISSEGLPPHSIEGVVYAPTVSDTDIAEAIFAAKAAGIEAHGDTIVQVTDSQGVDHNIGVSRATVYNIHLEIDVDVNDDIYDGDSDLAQVVADWGDLNLTIGDNVILTQIVAAIFDGVTGIVDVTEIRIGLAASPTWTSNWPIVWDGLAALDTARITVFNTPV